MHATPSSGFPVSIDADPISSSVPSVLGDIPLDSKRVAYSQDTWAQIEEDWRRLSEQTDIAFFRSVEWCKTWLEVFGKSLETEIFLVPGADTLAAACLLSHRTDRIMGLIPLRRTYLNTAGEPQGDGTSAEYNGVLFDARSSTETVALQFGSTLSNLKVDELLAAGLAKNELDFLRKSLPDWEAEISWSEDPYVDLNRVRLDGSSYRKAALSKNSRGQVNRTLNAYAKRGSIETEVAHSAGRALEMLAELKDLHQKTWTRRGQSGAFASETFCLFHQKLIRAAFDHQKILMIRVTVNEEPIGILYSFLDRGRVLFYQSGFRYEDDNRFRPGLATHVSAIEKCLDLGHSEYHFLAGDDLTPRYKQSLSTDHQQLAWVRMIRSSPKNSLLKFSRKLRRRIIRR